MSVKPIIFSGPMVRALLEGRKTQTRRTCPQPPKECGITYMLGNESWLPVEKRSPIRRTFEAWSGDLYHNRPEGHMCGSFEILPRWQIGDLLYVRETCSATVTHDALNAVRYEADQNWHVIDDTKEVADQWLKLYRYRGGLGATVPPIHMPRWASRLTLEVTDVRVQRLQEISEADAEAEGIEDCKSGGLAPLWRVYGPPPKPAFGMIGNLSNNRGQFATDARDSFSTLWDSIYEARGDGWNANPWVVALTFTVHKQNVSDLLKQREAA